MSDTNSADPVFYTSYHVPRAPGRPNELGMRTMQERAYERRGEQYLLIKSPPASGKSRALMFIALDKLANQGMKQAIIVVPEKSIGASFADEPLSLYGFWADWEVTPKWNLCNAPGTDDGGKVNSVAAFLASGDKILVCTHATFRFAVDKFGIEAFDDRLIAVDEFHHVSANPDNRLGTHLAAFLERGRVHIVAMTGSFFRGDAEAILSAADEAKFIAVTLEKDVGISFKEAEIESTLSGLATNVLSHKSKTARLNVEAEDTYPTHNAQASGKLMPQTLPSNLQIEGSDRDLLGFFIREEPQRKSKQLPSFSQTSPSYSPDTFLADIQSFNEFGKATISYVKDGIPYFVNEFWTAGQRQAHSLHEISYRACFKAQLPEFFISRLTRVGDAVLDPFMGRGTTPIQAALMRRQAYGVDINPLSVLLARPRLNKISLPAVVSALDTVDWEKGEIKRSDLLAFYHPKTLKKLESLRGWINDRAPLGLNEVDRVADWIRMVAINRLSGHSPGFFSGRSMPPNQAVSVKAQLKINEKLNVSPPERDVRQIIIKKTRTLLSDGLPATHAVSGLFTSAAWNLANLDNQSIDLTVTSPPFLDIVQYANDNWLRCWFAGIEPSSVAIDMHKTESAWTEMVRRVLVEQARILKFGGHIAFEVGELRGGRVLLEKLVWQAAEGLPFERLGVLINDQEFTKTANLWGVSNNKSGTNTNRIVILKRVK
jgi:DNA methylase